MGKGEAGSAKAIANAIKAKGELPQSLYSVERLLTPQALVG
jgi:hypothetical protein